MHPRVLCEWRTFRGGAGDVAAPGLYARDQWRSDDERDGASFVVKPRNTRITKLCIHYCALTTDCCIVLASACDASGRSGTTEGRKAERSHELLGLSILSQEVLNDLRLNHCRRSSAVLFQCAAHGDVTLMSVYKNKTHGGAGERRVECAMPVVHDAPSPRPAQDDIRPTFLGTATERPKGQLRIRTSAVT